MVNWDLFSPAEQKELDEYRAKVRKDISKVKKKNPKLKGTNYLKELAKKKIRFEESLKAYPKSELVKRGFKRLQKYARDRKTPAEAEADFNRIMGL